MIPAFFGLQGQALTAWEEGFFKEAGPAGFILFARNIDAPGQVRALTDHLRALMGRDDFPILIDQEGGRVARLRPPHWLSHPPAQIYGQLYDIDPERALKAITLTSRIIAAELLSSGINVDCLPVLDVPQEAADPIIGDRAYAKTPDLVAIIGRMAAQALLDLSLIHI